LEILTVTVIFVSIVLQMGLGTAVFKAVLYDKDKTEEVLISTAFYFLVTSSGVFILILYLLAPSIARLILDMPQYANLVRIVFFTAFLDIISIIPLARLRMHEESIKYSVVNIGKFAVGLLLNTYFIVGLRRGLEGLVIAGAIQSAIFALVLMGMLAKTLRLTFSGAALREMLSFGLPLVPMSVAANVLSMADRYFLRYYATLEETGLYAVGYKFGAVINLLVGSFQIAWPAVLFSVAKRDDAEKFYSKLLTYFVLVLASIGLGVSVLSREALKIVTTEQFYAAYQIVPLIVLSHIFLGGYYVTAVGTNLKEKTQYLALATITAAIIHLILNFLLIPGYGMMGAAVSTVISYAVMAAITCGSSLRFYPIGYEWGRLVKIMAVAAMLYGASSLIHTDILAVDVLLKTTVVAAFPLLLHLLNFYTEKELSKVRLGQALHWAEVNRREALNWLRRVLRKTQYRLLKILANILLPPTPAAIEHQQVDRILIYGALGIGNMIMFTPTLKSIRQRFPDAHITLLVAQSGCEEVVRESPLVNEIIKARPGRWETLKLVKQIRGRHFDLLISEFHGEAFKYITVFSGIPNRLGHCTSPGWRSLYDFLHNVPVGMEEDEHEIDRDLRLAQALGIQVTDGSPLFYVSDGDRAFASEFLRQNGVRDGDLVVGVQVGTWRVQSWKQWDIARLAQLCDLLVEKYEAKAIALGSSKHQEELEIFLSSMKRQPIIALGKASLKQAAAIVEHCDFTICNDSGLMHIAAAMGTPVIAIYGPTDYHRTSPCRYGKQHIVVTKGLECSPCFRMAGEDKVIGCIHRSCLELIKVEDVLRAAEEIIARKLG